MTDAHTSRELLEKERQTSGALDEHVHRLKEEAEEAAKRVQACQAKEKELTDRYR